MELETREKTQNPKNNNIELSLGDIIEIIAPSNKFVNNQSFYIDYIDNEIIELININTGINHILKITSENNLSDESIEKIYILSKSEEEGYAKQNNLLPKTWIDIHIGGDIPEYITGQITNLEEDQIEVKILDDDRLIYIDFDYKGIPKNIPIKSIEIREKPKDLKMKLFENVESECEVPIEEQSTVEYTESGEMIINIPENAIKDDNYRETLKVLYDDADEITFGEELDEITIIKEKPLSQITYGLEIQTNDMLDEFLSTIPDYLRNLDVKNNIHRLIERYKQLRNNFSIFDENMNISRNVKKGKYYKPLVEKLKKLDFNLDWIIPVVSLQKEIILNTKNNKNLDEEEEEGTLVDNKDIKTINLSDFLNNLQEILDEYKNKSTPHRYEKYINRIYREMKPFNCTYMNYSDEFLIKEKVINDKEVVIENTNDYNSTVNDNNTKKFGIVRANVGYQTNKPVLTKSGKIIYEKRNITENDEISVKSFILLPEIILKNSGVNLKSNNLLEKVILNNNYVPIFQILNDATNIQKYEIDDLDNKIEYGKNISFLKKITEYYLSDTLQDDNEKYEKFLKKIVPDTFTLINLIIKDMKLKDLSTTKIVKELEQFGITIDDIHYKHFEAIRYFIKNKMIEYRENYREKELENKELKNLIVNDNSEKNIFDKILFDKTELVNMLLDGYNLKDEELGKFTNSELYNYLLKKDGLRLLSTVITYSISKTLKTPVNILEDFEPAKLDDTTEIEQIKPRNTANRYLSKIYTNISDLKNDENTDDIYYDKELDDTPYDILKLYDKEKKSMDEKLFKEFLIQNLIDRHNVNENYANELAKTLILGKKEIKDGEYALLQIKPKLPKEIDYDKLSEKEKKDIEIEEEIREKRGYYYRLNNKWIYDSTIDPEIFIDTKILFENIKELDNRSNKNTSKEDQEKLKIKELARARIVKEFDNRVDLSLEEISEKIKKDMDNQFIKLLNLNLIEESKNNKYNNYAYELGNTLLESEFVTSPHLELRDQIIAQTDFVKKQEDLLKFIEYFCRDPMQDVEKQEENDWYYCKETNTKLLPKFLGELAYAYLADDYENKLAEIISKIGKLSDNEDSIVGNGGFEIVKRDFVNEDQFTDEGFRIITHSVIEKDLETRLNTSNLVEKKIFQDDQTQMIYNLLNTLCENIGISIDDVNEFVIRKSTEYISKIIDNEEKYIEDGKEYTKQTNKKPPPYEIYKNRLIFWIITSFLLIRLQTFLKPVNKKKTFPSCTYSFNGYPLTGIEDLSGIRYLACVLYKLGKNTEPWISIKKLKEEVYVNKIKDTIEKFLIKDVEVENLYLDKKQYLTIHSFEEIPDENDYKKWTSFLPPLVNINLGSIRTISKDLEKELMDSMKKQNKNQHDLINVLKCKSKMYGYGIIDIINKIVLKKNPILKTVTNNPFIENSCCNEKIQNVIEYFNEDNELISNYLNTSLELKEFLNEIKKIQKPSILHHKEFTGTVIQETNMNISEENLYSCFIEYCNLNKEKPVPNDYLYLFPEKPNEFPLNENILEQIEFLKRKNKNFSKKDLDILLQKKNLNNLIELEKDNEFNEIDAVKDLLEDFERNEYHIIDDIFRKHLNKILDNYKQNQMSNEISSDLKNFKNYLVKITENIYNEIIDFFDEYGNLNTNNYNKLQDYLLEFTNNNLSYKDSIYNSHKNLKNSLYSIIKSFPSMLTLQKNYFNKLPQHWNLADNHYALLNTNMQKYWSFISKYSDDKVLEKIILQTQENLMNLYIFVEKLPIQIPIEKNGEKYYSLFDEETINLLFMYFYYSCLYEYISVANDNEFMMQDLFNKKDINKKQLEDEKNVSNQNMGINDNKDIEELNMKLLVETEEEALKNKVANILLEFINLDKINKYTLLSYDEFMKKTRRYKLLESEKMEKYFASKEKDERDIETQFKKYKMGAFNLGLQKAVYEYDKEYWNTERNNMNEVLDNNNEVIMNEINLNLDNEIYEESNEEMIEGIMGFNHLGENFMDGDPDGEYREDENDFGDI